MNQNRWTLPRWHALLALPLFAVSLPAAEPAPQDLLRTAKKNMVDHTWKVNVMAQGDHPMKIAGLLHDQDFDITVRTEGGESRQIAIGKKCWMTRDHGKTWKAYPTADRRFYYLTHASINSSANEKIPPFEKLETKEEDGVTTTHVRLINEQPVAYEGDRSNAWIVMKNGKADVVTRYMGPRWFMRMTTSPADVHFTAAWMKSWAIVPPPPGNANAAANLNGPEDLLVAAIKKNQESLWEVDAQITGTKTAHFRGFFNGEDFDLRLDPKENDGNVMHGIRSKGTVYGSLDEGETWKIEPPSDTVPYNLMHGPIIYKPIMPAFEEVEKEQHDGETWVRVRLKVEEKVTDKAELPNYWIALDKDGQPTGVRRYEGFLLSQGKPLQCKILYKPADATHAITAPPADKIVNAKKQVLEKSGGSPTAPKTSTHLVDLPEGKLKIELPDAFKLDETDKKKDPQQLAMFSREDGVWGAVTRGTRGITPERLNGYMNSKVASYTKDLPKEFNVKWLKHEIVTIDGREWADMRYIPTPKGTKTAPKEFKEYANNPLYTRILGTSYKGQLLEITFTSNLDTEPATKKLIDRIMESLEIQDVESSREPSAVGNGRSPSCFNYTAKSQHFNRFLANFEEKSGEAENTLESEDIMRGTVCYGESRSEDASPTFSLPPPRINPARQRKLAFLANRQSHFSGPDGAAVPFQQPRQDIGHCRR